MKFGLIYGMAVVKPWYDGIESDAYFNAIEEIQLAEKLGFGYLWGVEHHFLTEYSHCSAPEVFLAAVSQHTSTIRIGHGVTLLPTPYNHPIRVAERIATLDILSRGRVEFGTGRSGSMTELGGFSIDPADTRPMWEEALHAIPKMWTEDPFSHQGKYFQMPARSVVPKPVQKPHPPIWAAATQPDTFELAGRFGVGVLGFTFGTPADFKTRIDAYRAAIRDPEPVGAFVNEQVAASLLACCAPTDEEAYHLAGPGAEFFREYTRAFREQFRGTTVASYQYRGRAADTELRYKQGVSIAEHAAIGSACVGSPKSCVKILKAYEEIGVDQMILNVQLGGIAHQKVMQSIELFGEEVIPHFSK